MAINNLTELVQSLSNDPTLATVPVTTDGTSVSQLRLNPISSGITQKATTDTVTVTVPVIEDTAVIVESPAAADNDQGTTNELLLTDLDGRLAVVEGSYATTSFVEDNYATTTYVDSAISGIVDGAPAVLDTLNEIVSALDGDPDFAGTITSEIASKANIQDPTFLGTLTTGSIQLSGNTISTTDSSGIVITEALTANSSLTVDDDLTIKGGIVYPDDKIKIGTAAGAVNQGDLSIAVGLGSGKLNQDAGGIAIGADAGEENQGQNGIALGVQTAQYNQSKDAIAIGSVAGQAFQADDAIAIGTLAGATSQGTKSIAIGERAGYLNQHANSIVLNATGSALNSDGTGRFFVKPVREVATGSPPAGFYQVYYNPTTGEFIYLS